LRDWAEWCRNTTVEPGDGTVTEPMLADDAVSNRALRNSAAKSVIGNPTATAANPSDITSGGNGTFLGERSGALQFVALQDGDIPASIARDAEVSTAISAAITAHAGLADPHTVYPLATGAETISGQWIFTSAASGLDFPVTLQSGAPGVLWHETDAAADNKYWRDYISGTVRIRDAVNDANNASTEYERITRSGSAVTEVRYTATLIRLNGAVRVDAATTAVAPAAGAGGALPATPAGYVTVNIAGTDRQIPYY
jgi:hypothetical protein